MVHGQEVTHYAFYDKARATMQKINEGKNRKGGDGVKKESEVKRCRSEEKHHRRNKC